MGIFDLFKRNKKTIRNERSSSEQVAFAESVLLIISPTIEKFGFKRVEKTIKEYSTTITFRKRDQYIKVENSSYPTDYPYYYFIVLGEWWFFWIWLEFCFVSRFSEYCRPNVGRDFLLVSARWFKICRNDKREYRKSKSGYIEIRSHISRRWSIHVLSSKKKSKWRQRAL